MRTVNEDLIAIRIMLAGVAEAVAGNEEVAASVKSVGTAAGESTAASDASAAATGGSGRAARTAEKDVSKLGKAHQFLGKAAMFGAGILGIGSIVALKAAFDHTQQLGLATQKLTLQTGMNTRQASKWVEITQARGIQSTQLSMGMSTLSKQMSSANQGTATSIDLFKRWGVTQQDLKSMSTEQVIMKISDAFEKVHTSAGRAARAADVKTLFGRSGTAMLPLMSMGSKGIRGQLDQAGGMNKDQLKQILESKAAMRQLGLAVNDLKNKLAIALIPVILAIVKGLLAFAQGLEHGKGWAIAIAAAVGALAAAFVAMGIAAAIAWVAALSPAILVAGAVAAVVAIFVTLYMKVKFFHNAVNAVWGFIKSHWQLLSAIFAPFVLILVTIVQHFGQIRGAAQAAFRWISNAVGNVAHAIGAAFSAAFSVVQSVIQWVVGKITWLVQKITWILNQLPNIHLPGGGGGGGGVPGAVGGALKQGLNAVGGGTAGNILGALADGGTFSHGSYIVGEQGMELATITPSGVNITPLKGASKTPASGRARRSDGTPMRSRGDVYLDRRKVGNVIHEFFEEEVARS